MIILGDSDEEVEDLQLLCKEIWAASTPENIKPPHFETFDGKRTPLEHLAKYL